MWSTIIKSLLSIAEKVLDRENFKLLTARSDKIADLETELNAEYAKPLDLQDDLKIPALEDALDVELAAFARQLDVVSHTAPSGGTSP